MKYSVNFLVFLILIICFVQSCSTSGIKILNQEDYYSREFLQQMDSIRTIYKDGDKQLALRKLQNIPDETITSAERAKKYNMLGVVYFSNRNLPKAIENFQLAKQYVEKDYQLASQINLNLASSYYKYNNIELSRAMLKAVNLDYFKDVEKEKYHKLNLSVSNQNGDIKLLVDSLIFLIKDANSFSDVDDYQYKELLVDSYRKLASSQRVHFLDKYQKERPVVVAYLGKQEVLQRFYQGDKSGAQDVVGWLEKRFNSIEEVKTFIEDYWYRVENFSKINSGAVGVIVPLSGSSKSRYGKKVIAGINTSLEKYGNEAQSLNLYIKDNMNNDYLARKHVQELVMKHHVSVIIGGLFPKLAKAEYLEARKYGVLYIALSPVYLPREEKNHLLVEMQGSVESQINAILEPSILNYFGKRLAILYPWADGGKSYINELWGHHNSGKIELASLNHYEKGIKDYRSSVKKLLWLNNPRERKEELLIWKDIRSLEKGNFRIINEMPPIVDFDWVFVPSLPREAIQILPTFNYYDAKNLKFVGGPSWINKYLRNEQSNLGKMYLIGNEIEEKGAKFQAEYQQHNGKKPHLVDTISYESMMIVNKILEKQVFDKREDLESRMLDLKEISGITSNWKLVNGLWLKDMDIMKISSKGFTKLEIN